MLRQKSELLSTAESSANLGSKNQETQLSKTSKKATEKKLAHNCPQARRAERQKELEISPARRQLQEDRFYLDYRIVG